MVAPAIDGALFERAPKPATADAPRREVALRIVLALAAVAVLALGFEAVSEAAATGDVLELAAWAGAALAIALSILTTLRYMQVQQRANERAEAALKRARTAEKEQRARADELGDVLRASEGLVLMGEGKLDFMGILGTITPTGCTSFLAVPQAGDVVVIAAHGPLAPWFIGLRQPAASLANSPVLSSYSAAGRLVGLSVPAFEVPGMSLEIEATLAVRFADHAGNVLGWLNVLDPRDERILEPMFVSVAQLVANQIGVAMENRALLNRTRSQLDEVRRVQAQLVQVAKLGAVGELAAAVAHEVNNPLTGILGFSELLLAELPETDPRHQEVAIIHSEAVRARAIVRSLLEFARPRPPQRIPTDLNDLVRATLDLARFRLENCGVRVSANYGELPVLELDPDALKQVLLNLVNNAIEAMPQGGNLRLATSMVGGRVSVSVVDSGIGMEGETLDRIFTPFFTTRAGNRGGTGLGLSVSRQIVEGHGGTVEVESEPGKGSTFTVWLPATSEESADQVIAPAPDAEPMAAVDWSGAGVSSSAEPAVAGGRRSGRRGAAA